VDTTCVSFKMEGEGDGVSWLRRGDGQTTCRWVVNVYASDVISDVTNLPLALIHHMMAVLPLHSLGIPLLVLFRPAHKMRESIVSDGQL